MTDEHDTNEEAPAQADDVEAVLDKVRGRREEASRLSQCAK